MKQFQSRQWNFGDYATSLYDNFSDYIFSFYDYYVMFSWLTCCIMWECKTKFESILLFF